MGRRRRRWREPGYAWWTVFAGLVVVAVLAASWRLALVALLAWCLYEFALNPTACRVMTRQGFACHEPVRGRLYACSPGHQQVKNDALWHAAGLPRPFRGRLAQDPDPETGVVVYSPPVRARLPQNDRIVLTIAAAGTLLCVVATVVGLLGD